MCSNDDTILSQTVDWLRFPLVIDVVFIHCYSHDFDMEAMRLSPVDPSRIKQFVATALTDRIDDREMFMKGIDYSYYYEKED